ncbi:DUF45 domain-containing protein [Chitinimonas koreensis]|uniref:DUF45 domain-containing protein n=1 Tax=Chitinimonas koreensis TaxID=356302 RepID=UPI00165441AD|nr:DUF45 domain-containing protein [Chitinimonas koreensis]QNM96503.1 DUF45 domain-containing protein [Chitinimonas koreensis]
MARSLPEAVRLFTVAGRSVPVRLTRSARRSVGLRIGPDGLAVTLPNRFPLYELDAVLQRKADWIVAKLDELAAGRAPSRWPTARRSTGSASRMRSGSATCAAK